MNNISYTQISFQKSRRDNVKRIILLGITERVTSSLNPV